ncbi:MAG: hypothetical protein KC486_12045 [Myxococcales bacterium]|nr:hypothetical protein [Myxococcales bacterium]
MIRMAETTKYRCKLCGATLEDGTVKAHFDKLHPTADKLLAYKLSEATLGAPTAAPKLSATTLSAAKLSPQLAQAAKIGLESLKVETLGDRRIVDPDETPTYWYAFSVTED